MLFEDAKRNFMRQYLSWLWLESKGVLKRAEDLSGMGRWWIWRQSKKCGYKWKRVPIDSEAAIRKRRSRLNQQAERERQEQPA